MSYQEQIAAKLRQLEQVVQDAKRENRNGWTIQQDLRKLRIVLDELEILDTSDRQSRSLEE